MSAGLASTGEHVDRLLAAVATLAVDGPGAEYEHIADQGWVPIDDTRELDAPLPWWFRADRLIWLISLSGGATKHRAHGVAHRPPGCKAEV